MLRRRSTAGFTLLEVMIAVSIMTVALAAILTSESGSINLTIKTKELNTAGWLAHNIMVESEHLLEGKPFSELSKIESKRFPAPYERYAWKREIKELKFPDIAQATKEGQGVSEAARILAKTITKFLNNTVREMVITVTWPHGTGEEQMVLSTYLIDLEGEFDFSI